MTAKPGNLIDCWPVPLCHCDISYIYALLRPRGLPQPHLRATQAALSSVVPLNSTVLVSRRGGSSKLYVDTFSGLQAPMPIPTCHSRRSSRTADAAAAAPEDARQHALYSAAVSYPTSRLQADFPWVTRCLHPPLVESQQENSAKLAAAACCCAGRFCCHMMCDFQPAITLVLRATTLIILSDTRHPCRPTHLPEVIPMQVEGVLLPPVAGTGQGRVARVLPTKQPSPVILDHDLNHLARLDSQHVCGG